MSMVVGKAEIAALLKKKGWNQTKLAEVCNVSQGTVSRWLKGLTVPDPEPQSILRRLIDEPAPQTAEPTAIPNECSVEAILSAVEGSYRMLGLDQDEAAELIKLVLSVASKQPTPSAGPDYYRILSETLVREFLQSKQIQ